MTSIASPSFAAKSRDDLTAAEQSNSVAQAARNMDRLFAEANGVAPRCADAVHRERMEAAMNDIHGGHPDDPNYLSVDC